MSNFASLLNSFKKSVDEQRIISKKSIAVADHGSKEQSMYSTGAMGTYYGGARNLRQPVLKDSFVEGQVVGGTSTHTCTDKLYGYVHLDPSPEQRSCVRNHNSKKRRKIAHGFRLEESLSKTLKILDKIPHGELSDDILISHIQNCMGKWAWYQQWTAMEAELAEKLLFRMEKEDSNKTNNSKNEYRHVGFTLTLDHYVNCMHAWVRCETDWNSAGFRAEKILHRMDGRVRNEKRLDLAPNRFAINTCIGAYARGASRERRRAAEDAERLLNRLEKSYIDSGDPELRPSDRSYSKVIDAWAGASDPTRAMSVLKRMETQYLSGNIKAKPNTLCYTCVLDSIAKGSRLIGNGRQNAEEAENIIRGMLAMYHSGIKELKPDCILFGPVIDAWAKSGISNASEKALGVLKLMKAEKIEPDVTIYNIVINTFASEGTKKSLLCAEKILSDLENNPNVQADCFSYNGVLKAYANNGDPERGKDLLDRWINEFKHNRALDKPDMYTFSSICQAWSKSKCRDSGDRARSVIDWMEKNGLDANKYCYNSCITAYVHNNDIEKAELMLDRLEKKKQLTLSHDMKPDIFSYNSILFGLGRNSKGPGPERADQYLRRLITRGMHVDLRCFGSVLTCWARSGQSCAPDRCLDLLSLMPSVGVLVDTICYNSAIHSFVQCVGMVDSGRRAMELFKKMITEGVKRSSVTYTIMVCACAKEEQITRDRLLCQVFHNCINDGMLDVKVANALSQYHIIDIQGSIDLYFSGKSPQCWSCDATRGPKTKSYKEVQANMLRPRKTKRTKNSDRSQPEAV